MSESTLTFEQMIAAAKAAGGSSEAPAVGTHEGVVKAAKMKISSTGKLGISMLLQVTDPADASNGCQIWGQQYLTIPRQGEPAKSAGIFFRTFEGLGIPMSFWAGFDSTTRAGLEAAGAQVATLIKGKPCKFSVKMGEWQGEPRPEVGFIGKGSGVGLEGAGASTAPAAPLPSVAPLAPVASAAPLPPSPERPF